MEGERPTDELLRRMLSAVVRTLASDEQAGRLVAAAGAEAEAEVKDLLKTAIKAALLERAVARLESDGGSTPEIAPGPEAEAPHPEAEAPPPPPATVEPARAGAKTGAVACYVYGITRAGNGPPPDVEGVDPRVPLHFVSQGGVRALASAIALDEFGSEAMAEQVKDLAWVEQKVRAHDAVVKEMLARGPVAPCRFCTVLRDEQDVRAVLARHEASLLATLDALEGKKEWGVKVFAPPAEAAPPAPQSAAASGKDYFLQKKRDEQARAEAARAARDAGEACHRELSAVASAATKLPAGSRGIDERRGARPPESVLNAAYLVADAHLDAFHSLVAALAAQYAAVGVTVEVTGPWPPYNFVSLDLSLEPAALRAEPEAAA